MKVFYEVWGMDDDETQLSRFYKFDVIDPLSRASDTAAREFAQKAADELTNNDVRQVEVRRVEEP